MTWIPTSGYLFEEQKNTNSKRYMHPYVHCSITCNSQDTAKCPSIDGWMDKEDVVYIYNASLNFDMLSFIVIQFKI